MIETPHIQALVAISKFHSYSKAAEELGVTQSAVSQNIKNLEAKLGHKVVDKVGKQIIVTAIGQKLATLGLDYFQKFDELKEEFDQDKTDIKGELKVGTMPGIGKSWVGHKLIEFSRLYPELSIQLMLDFPADILTAFDKQDYHCLILPQNFIPAHAESKLLHEEHSTLVFPKDAFNVTDDITLKQLAEMPLIFFEKKDPLFYYWCRQRFNNVPKGVKPRLVLNSFGQILHAVSLGLGIAVVPTHVLNRSAFKDKVETLGKEYIVHNNSFHFIFHAEFKDSLKLKTFFEFLHLEAKTLDI